MSRHFESRRTHSGFAELASGRAKACKKTCRECGSGLLDNRKTYCAPCYDVRLQGHNTRNRKIYADKIKARKVG
jgi:hypothetical protein